MKIMCIVAFAFIADMLFASVSDNRAPVATSVVERAVLQAFRASRVRIQVGPQSARTTLVLDGQAGVESEKVAVSQAISVDLTAGTRAIAFSVSMLDRLERLSKAIDHQQYTQHQETAYFLLAVEKQDGELDVYRMCAAEPSEVSGFYGDYEEMAILGSNRQQVGVSYTSCFQDEDTMGARKRRIIYDLPSGREIFNVIIADYSMALSGRGRKWLLSYHKYPKVAANEIHRREEGSDETEVYQFDGTAFVFGRKESTSVKTPQILQDISESYRKQMKWNGLPLQSIHGAASEGLRLTENNVEFDDLSDDELTKIVKAAYPDAPRVELVRRIEEVSRWGDATNWTGEVEFMLEDVNAQKQRCYLVWPARCVLTNGVALLSGLILPNQKGIKHYRDVSDRRAAKKETTQALFACIRVDPQGGGTRYRDIVADGVYGITDSIGGRTGFHCEPSEGLFREVLTRTLRAAKPHAGGASVLIEEGWIHVYELLDQKLVLRIPCWATYGGTNVFATGGNPEWQDVDGDQKAELIVKDAETSGYIYKWQQGAYVYSSYGEIQPAPKQYRPSSLNPYIKVTIVVKDERGLPVNACDIRGEITTKHENIVAVFREPRIRYTPLLTRTDTNGKALLETRGFTITLEVSRSGYTTQRMKLRPFAEPVPDVLNITLRKTP